MQLSWIQREILSTMLRHDSTHVKEMLPDGMPANLFSYHLDGLTRAGYIEKVARGEYRFTVSGEKLAGSFSSDTKHITENIKTVIVFHAKVGGRRLLFRWSRHPYLHKVTPVYDRMKHGQSLDEALRQALTDKLVSDAEVKYRKSALIKIMHDGRVISHMHAMIYDVALPADFLEITTRNGTAFMADVDYEPMKGVGDFLDYVESDLAQIAEFVWRY